jgi:hypothetical protein
MSKKIEVNLTMDQLWILRGLISASDKNGDLANLYNLLDEKIYMNWEPIETTEEE